MIATMVAKAATTAMIGALDGGAIKADNDATLNQPGHRGGSKANELWAAALFQELFNLTDEQFLL
jgi:hypothetical protein